MNNRRLWLGLLALLVFVAVAVAWRAATYKDERPTDAISDDIRSWADEQTTRTVPIDVMCPETVEWEVGGEFHCIVSQGQQSMRVTVTMESDAGMVTWQAG